MGRARSIAICAAISAITATALTAYLLRGKKDSNPPQDPTNSSQQARAPIDVDPPDMTTTGPGGTPNTEGLVRHVDPAGARRVLSEEVGAQILDVRTPEEFAAGHLDGAVNVDFQAADFREQAAKLESSTTWIVHCQVGGRSMWALPTLKELGFLRIVHLDGGYEAWVACGFPTVR